MRALLCRVSMALLFTRCASTGDDGLEISKQVAPLHIDDDAEPAPEVSASPSDPRHGLRHLALPGGRVLRAGRVLRVLDLRDPQQPRVEGVLDGYQVFDELLYPIANHAIVSAGSDQLYRGEREDVAIPRSSTGGLLNVDISDRANLRVVNIVRGRGQSGPLALGQGQHGGAVYRAEPHEQPGFAYLARYELQDEELVLTGEIQLQSEVEKIETSGNKVLVGLRNPGKPARVAVVDGSGPELHAVYETSVPGSYRDVHALAIDGPKLRVAYARKLGEWDSSPAIDTFDLSKDDALGRVGRCDIGPAPDDIYSTYINTTLYSKGDHTLYASDDGQGLTYQIPFSASGKCPLRRVLGSGDSKAFQAPEAQRLFAIQRGELRLFDTRRSASVPLLAGAPIFEGYYGYSYGTRPIHVLGLEQAATADNGSSEPWLVGLAWTDEYSGLAESFFELFSASNRTVTARSLIKQYGFAGDLALYGATLVTMSSQGLRTYDIRDLSAPKQLGTLDLDVSFSPNFRFGDHVLRVRSAPPIGPPNGAEPVQEMLLERLDTVGATPVASWPIRRDSFWLKAEELLLEARWIYTSSPLSPYLLIQVYDLSEPSRPRKAGVFFSDEIRPTNNGARLIYRVVGRALVIAQRMEVDGAAQSPWSNLRVIDFRDPDEPKMAADVLNVPDADFSGLADSLPVGSSLFISRQKADGLYATRLYLEEPEYPYLGAEVLIPAPMRAVTADAVFTATPSFEPTDLTVSRFPWTWTASQPSATRTWPGRRLTSLHSDGGPYLYLTHALPWDAPRGTEPRSNWVRLEVLDAHTLDTVGDLDLDIEGTIEASASGRLFIAIRDALLFVDVRDPTRPTARAAVPFTFYKAMTIHDDRVYVASERVQSYPIELQNLIP